METTVSEAARRLGVSVRTVHRMIDDGRLQSVTRGRYRRVIFSETTTPADVALVLPEEADEAVLRAKVLLLADENRWLRQMLAEREQTLRLMVPALPAPAPVRTRPPILARLKEWLSRGLQGHRQATGETIGQEPVSLDS